MIKTSIQKLTERLKAKTSDEEGFTLIELLLTLAISAILLPVIYGTFLTGYKIYEKVSIEGQLREDADYVSAMLMNSLYSTPFDYVDECEDEDNCLIFVDNIETARNNYNPEVIDQDKKRDEEDIDSFKIKLVEKNGKHVWETAAGTIDTPSDFRGSSISFACSNPHQDDFNDDDTKEEKCTNAIIELDFSIAHENVDRNEQLNLESQFGF
ncbi:prepilin-type N-terminal cleavage/methylation domain-containing protein [Rossellomorea vietnamensis]|uniref:Prepilin-type N-terminal cleavage/methylation domain-containing protein n=1 Tax=Rossellomorea vietnamensis TaxID=218284 RepID=A0A5D4MHC4_9BACI|nr:prepilin-type N-terminal cleavage/methylation domain-containing protein [Rossellomorea vietnamensis]TYS00928.1 prepilin-type N-terminal cleavage/methylation domain-containing protein [Rossellomorea vietnamensis]